MDPRLLRARKMSKPRKPTSRPEVLSLYGISYRKGLVLTIPCINCILSAEAGMGCSSHLAQTFSCPDKPHGRSRSRRRVEHRLLASHNPTTCDHRISSWIPRHWHASPWAVHWSSSHHSAAAGLGTAWWAWRSTRAGSCCPCHPGSSARRFVQVQEAS